MVLIFKDFDIEACCDIPGWHKPIKLGELTSSFELCNDILSYLNTA